MLGLQYGSNYIGSKKVGRSGIWYWARG